MKILKNKNQVVITTLAFILPLVVGVVWYYLMNFYPFSNNTLYISDLSGQYRAFFSYYRRWLIGEESFQYSWDVLGGMNMVGNFGYYLGSIFNPVVVLFPENKLYEGIILLLAVKTSAVGGAMYFYMKTIIKRNKWMPLLFSVFFAFCGMYVGYYFNILWLDAYIYLPLILIGLKNSIQTSRFSLLYIISLSLMFIANFYMSYMVGVFTFIMCLIYLSSDKYSFKEGLIHFWRFIQMTFVSFGLSCFVLIPTFLQLAKANTNQIELSFEVLSIFRILGKLFSGVYYPFSLLDTEIYPHIYSGVLILVLVIPFFMIKGITKDKKYLYGAFLFFMIVCLMIPAIGNFWQAFSTPTGFPFRFGYLFSFLLITIGAETYEHIDIADKKYLLCSYLIISLILALVFWQVEEVTITIWFINQVLLTVTLFLFTYWEKSYLPGLFLFLLFIFCLGDLAFNSVMYGKQIGNTTTYRAYESRDYSANIEGDIANALKKLEEVSGTDIVRVKSSYKSFSADNLFYNFSSVGGFTSLQSEDYSNMMSELGYSSSRVSVNSNGGTVLTDDLFNVTAKLMPTYRIVADSGDEKIFTTGNLELYKKPYTVSLGNIVPSEELSEIWESDPEEQIVRLFGGEPSDILTYITSDIIQEENVVLEDYVYRKKSTAAQAELTIQLEELTEDESLYVKFTTPGSIKGVTYSFNRQRGIEASRAYSLVEPGAEVMTISWNENQKISSYGIVFLKINTSKWQELMKAQYEENALSVNEITNTSFSGIIESSNGGEKLLLSIPYDKGWKFKVNEKEVVGQKVLTSLIALELPQGENIIIEGYYSPPGLIVGQVISIGTILLLVLRKVNDKWKIINFKPSKRGI